MKTKIALFLSPLASLLLVGTAHAQVSTTTINSAISAVKDDVSSVAGTAITLVLAFVGLLIAAGWAWRFLKRHVGKKI